MGFPEYRPRRMRATPAIREMVAETALAPANLIAPLFVIPGSNQRREIRPLPGHSQLSSDLIVQEASRLRERGIRSVLLFGLPERKDEVGSSSYDENGVVQQAIRALKRELPDMAVVADLCFCEYTSHGHCGVIVDGDVDNDQTLAETAKQTVSLAAAGADIVAPSGMMDGMVATIREALDENGFAGVSIMSYAAKYASAFYGPFREAADCAPQFGDRRTYQMDPRNSDEAIREVELDIQEGADIIMVKPALSYLDIISRVKDSFPIPLAAYAVSGEYAMVKAAAAAGMVDGPAVLKEMLVSIRRAGADMIITYAIDDVLPHL
ncbi:MAG: porphobilinogen synthase [Bdellovibrionales bacterium]|nr:porphobilinogen synthase [Bdellovibrionales bacterium]